MATDVLSDISKEQEWCINLRRLLKAKSSRMRSSGESDLRSSEAKARQALGELKKLDPVLEQKFESKYRSLAENARTLTETDIEAAKLVSVELDLLEAQINKEIAAKELAAKPTDKKARKNLDKAEKELGKVNQKLDGAFQKLLTAANDFVFKIKAEPFHEHSAKQTELVDLRNKWKQAHEEAQTQSETVILDYARALTELPRCSELFDAALKEVQGLQKEETQRKEYEGKYQSKIERLTNVRNNLLGRMGLAAEIKQLEDVMAEAEKRLKPETGDKVQYPKYNAAFQYIKSVIDKTSSFEKAALEKEKNLQSGLMKDPEVKERHDIAVQALDRLVETGKELIADAEYELQMKAISSALGLLADGKRDEAFGKLDSLGNEFKTTYGVLKPIRETCNELVGTIAEKLKELSYQPDEQIRIDLQLWNNSLQEARTDIGLREFRDARQLLLELKPVVSEAHLKCQTKPSDFENEWTTGAPQIWRDYLTPVVAPENTIQYKLLQEALQLAKSRDFAKAIEVLERAYETAKRIADQNSFQSTSEFTRIVEEVNQQIEACRQAISALETHLKSVSEFDETQQAALIAAKKELLQIKIQFWESIRRNATTAEEMTEAKVMTGNDNQPVATGFANAFAALADYFNSQTDEKNARQLRGELRRSIYQQGAKALAETLRQLDAKLRELAEFRQDALYRKLVGKRNSIEAAAPDPTGGFEESIRQLESLGTEVEQATESARQALQQEQENFKQQLVLLNKAIVDLKDSVKDESKWSQRKFFAPFFEELDSDAVALGGIEKSTSLSSLQQGVTEIQNLLQTIAQWKLEIGKPVGNLQELVADALGKNDPIVDPEASDLELLFSEDGLDSLIRPEVTPSFALVLAALEAIQKELDNDDLKKIKPTTNHLLLEDFGKLRGEVKGLNPKDGLQRLRAYQQSLATALDETSVAKEKRNRFSTTLLPAARTLFREVAGVDPERKLKFIGKTDKAYFEELEKDFVAAKNLISDEGKEDSAISKLESFTQSLNALKLDPELLQTREEEARERVLKAAQEEQQFKTKVFEFRNKSPLPQVKEALKIDGADKTLLTDCENLVKKAEDIFAKTGNYESAIAILELAHDRAENAIKFPLGLAATARGELPKVAARWKKAVRAYVDSVNEVIGNVNREVEEEIKNPAPPESSSGPTDPPEKPPENVVEQIQSAQRSVVASLEKMKRFFNPDQFDRCITTLTTKKIDPREARAAREDGLRAVRRYMDMIMKDPLMIKVMKVPRPFGVVELSTIYAALRDLDLNLQRSVQ